MLDHHLQRGIVYRLALEDNLRFSELKPADIENKLFTYHLKKVLAAGYVNKSNDGLYHLTAEGRRLGIRVLSDPQTLADRAHSVLFLVIRRKSDGAWLLYQRKNQPLIGKVGFMHATPSADGATAATAATLCKERTGLSCEFKTLGGGYFRTFRGDELESFTHYTLLTADDAEGDLKQGNPDYAEYFWEVEPNFEASEMLPNMPTLIEAYQAGKPFFLEKSFQL